MKKLYDTGEISFAVISVTVYILSVGFLRNLGEDSPWRTLGLMALSAALYIFVSRNGLREKYGLSGWTKNSREMLCFIPLWIIAGGNLWGGMAPAYPVPGLIFAAVSMAFVGFAEELVFRGFLFRALLKHIGALPAIIISSVAFGLGHILNLFSGHELVPTLMQAAFAVAVGFAFSVTFYKSGSLLPCILAHSLINVFSLFSPAETSFVRNAVLHAVMIITAVSYCLYLMKRVETPPALSSGLPYENDLQ